MIRAGGKDQLMNIRDTELCLGLPGGGGGDGSAAAAAAAVAVKGNKRGFSETVDLKLNLNHRPNKEQSATDDDDDGASSVTVSKEKCASSKPPAKAQVVGWPPVRSYRKNVMAVASRQKSTSTPAAEAAYVKVSIDGAPYLRKVDLKMYKSYEDLSNALAKMFSSFTMGDYGAEGMIDFMNESKLMDLLNSSDYVPTYEDKDGDWMLVGDVPWEMFVESCKRLRIMKGSEAIGLAPRAMEKCRNRA